MTTAWLALTTILAAFAWLTIWARRPTASRYIAVAALPLALAAVWLALTSMLGKPADGGLPPGEYEVLGARIDVDEAIYVLLDGEPPRYHRLPYSAQAAEQLQGAIESGNGVQITMDGDGGEMTFHEPPIEADAPKRIERPSMRVGE
ncbi:hypothetical protein [Chelativorans xinjiangense]|uniref:hypothetical protein n=1 Tax=Chelativorans xinjiangense TaxID=2681485 RepID=UPI00135B77D6|nr:hypothetical protein [Chelativorans xinjiangense]